MPNSRKSWSRFLIRATRFASPTKVPAFPKAKKAQMPGFSSATSDMKRYIRGVGSGLPLVKEYLSFSHGRITIEDNIKCGPW